MTFLATGDLGPNRAKPDEIFDWVRALPGQGDLIFGQLEPRLAHTGSPLPQSRLPMRGDPEGGAAIARAGFDVISFATNPKNPPDPKTGEKRSDKILCMRELTASKSA